MEVDQIPQPAPAVEAPRGFHQGRVDEKGRLKIPAAFQQYLAALGESTLFITTLDLRTVRLYPISVWKENEKLFHKPGPLSREAKTVSFIAKHFGSDGELDPQGRVLIPQILRKELGIESQSVWLGYDQGAIEVLGDAVYNETLAVARAELAQSLETLKRNDLK